MDLAVRTLQRMAATGDKEAQDALRRAGMRTGTYQWTKRQVRAARFVHEVGDNARNVSLCEATARILTDNPNWYTHEKLFASGSQRPGATQAWFFYHCYPRLRKWAERVLRDVGELP